MYIYHKQCEILQKNHRNSSNIQFQWFPIEKGRKLCKRKRWNGWSKSIVLENKVVINFDFSRRAKRSGHLDYPLQSYGPNNTAYLGTKSETNIFKFRCILGPSAIKKGRLLAQPSYLSTLKPIKHFSGSLNFFPKVSRDTSQWAHCVEEGQRQAEEASQLLHQHCGREGAWVNIWLSALEALF